METTEEKTVIPRNRFIEATKRSIWSWVKFSQFFSVWNELFVFFLLLVLSSFFSVCHHLIHVFFYLFIFFSLFTCYSASLCWFFLSFFMLFNIFLYNYWRIWMCVGHTNASQCSTHPTDNFLFVSACKIYSNPKWRAEITQNPNEIANFIRSK